VSNRTEAEALLSGKGTQPPGLRVVDGNH